MGTIDLNDLAVFVCVVEAASFSEAAKRLGLPKSGVSRAIARLEDELGTRVLHRTTRKVAVSAAGALLYDRIRGDIASLRDTVSDLHEAADEPSGPLRITFSLNLEGFMAGVVSRYVQRYRQVEIELRLTNSYVDLVAEGIDLALRMSTSRLKDSALNARMLVPSVMQLFASPAYVARRGAPKTPKDLDDHEWVCYSASTTFMMDNGGTKLEVTSRGRITCDCMAFMREVIVLGHGIAYLPSFLSDEYVATGKLVPILPRWRIPMSTMWAVWPGRRRAPRKVALFLEMLEETLTTRPHW